MTGQEDEDAWFAPKSHGYGIGLPISRQGWATLIGYVALIVLASFLIPYSPLGYGLIVVAATAAFVLIAARKTRGGWHWRWGKRD
jgi:hypothetical protein